MRFNSAGMTILKKYEGCKLAAYWDVNAYSIGYGHHTGVNRGDVITQDQADAFLGEDLAEVEKDLQYPEFISLNDNQWSALVDFGFNEGVGKLWQSTLHQMLKDGDLKGAAAQLLKWTLIGSTSSPLLLRRRMDEQKLFNTAV